jgi:hypothetical protein
MAALPLWEQIVYIGSGRMTDPSEHFNGATKGIFNLYQKSLRNFECHSGRESSLEVHSAVPRVAGI